MRMHKPKDREQREMVSGHHGKDSRKDDDSRKRGRQQVSQNETARLRAEGGSGHS